MTLIPNRWGLLAGFLVARRAWRARPWQLPKGVVVALLLIELGLALALVRSCVGARADLGQFPLFTGRAE